MPGVDVFQHVTGQIQHPVEERHKMPLANLVPQNRFDFANNRCRIAP